MELLEEYQEFIERDPNDISCLWKLIPAIFYIVNAVTGYICSILFYMIWQDVFHGNCPLWANSFSIVNRKSQFDDIIEKIDGNTIDANWSNYVITNYDYNYECKIYFLSCFLSCAFGAIWSVMFLMCGRGGYGVGIHEAPWRIVLPATIFNLILVMIIMYTTIVLGEGYSIFSWNLKNVYIEISNIYKISQLTSECEIVQIYLQQYNTYEYDICKTFNWLEVLSYTQMWSWLAGLMTLVFRIITINDFRILKIRIYNVSNDFISNKANRDQNVRENDNKTDKEKME